MLIAGLQKTSFVDYPGQPCAVVFTPFCNMNCTYCHNAHILHDNPDPVPEEAVLAYLKKRQGLLHAVVISGGEPTLQQNLEPFIDEVKALGYLVKLDTNGLKPAVLQRLIREKMIDYVAMDVKGPLEKYDAVTRTKVDKDAIVRSITILRNSGIAHEFRTTFAPELTKEDIVAAAELIRGTEKYYLQQYRTRDENDPAPHLPSYVQETAQAVRAAIGVCVVRGLGSERESS